jgi:prepilin-type N-terminal cleavage/methylation domain-containing protein
MSSHARIRRKKDWTNSWVCQIGRLGGFTLLEMLIASFLIGVILLALWSLSSVYTRLFETGLRRVETVQVVRALVEQLRRDLLHAVQDPIGGITSGERRSVPVRRFGLFGSETELRLDVLQRLPNGGPSDGEYGEVASGATGVRQARLPELRTVYYRFRPSQDLEAFSETSEELHGELVQTSERSPVISGLLRWEEDFETPLAAKSEGGGQAPPIDISAASGGASRQGKGVTGFFSSPASLPELYQELEKTFGPHVLYLPEVSDFRLRYFDGQSWSSRWDSIARRALPVAIEVVFRVHLQGEGFARDSGPETETAGSLPSETAGIGGQGESVGAWQSYRIVVEIPGSPRFQGARRVPAASDRPPVSSVPARPTVPPRPPVARPVEIPRPFAPADQWMRVSE